MKVISLRPDVLDRWEHGDDRHHLACPSCGYFDTLLRMGLSEHSKAGVVKVIADHIRHDHEPPG